MSLNVQATEKSTAHALVDASQRLEYLAASFVSDTSHFFDACQQKNIWPKLESLTLTSKILDPQQNPVHINDFLETAALVAMKMPQLKSMELWNGSNGFAGVFQYQKCDWDASITWRGTWTLVFEPHVLKAWQAVASNCNLKVVTEILDGNVITSSADAIRYLRLRNTVVHLVSLWQMQKEAKR